MLCIWQSSSLNEKGSFERNAELYEQKYDKLQIENIYKKPR
jgi:hypothetical protein